MNTFEKDLQNKIGKYLSNWFIVEYEKWDDTGKNRIDLFLTNKQDSDFIIGIEIKQADKKRGGEMGIWIKQAIRYANTTWNNKVIPIFIYPPISLNYFILNNEEQKSCDNKVIGKDRHGYTSEHHSFNGFIAQFAIGELRRLKYNDYRNKKNIEYLCFCYNNKIIWEYKNYNKQENIRKDNYLITIEHIIKNR